MKILIKIFKVCYWPICQMYARHLGNKPADRLLRFLCSVEFWRVYHFWPNFMQPMRFSEKVWSRQLFARDPVFTTISDKFLVRDYISNKGGSEYLIPLIWSGANAEEIPFDVLPSKFVIKANHGCAYNVIVKDKNKLDRIKTIRLLKKWLSENFCMDTFLGIAWGYRNINPHIIIELFLEQNGKEPEDYKFFCFSGRMEFFKIDFNRFKGHSERFFDRDLNKLDLFEVGLMLYQEEILFPENLKEMIQVAETLSAGFDFIRVDLYSIGNKIYFSELTPYPGGSSAVFKPEKYDYLFGKLW